MTFARTPRMMLCTRCFSVCCDIASSDSSSGRPALTRVASCRVNSARSVAETRRAREKLRFLDFSCSETAVTVTGSSCRSRSNWRTCRGVSPSRIPLLSRPTVSTAVYSNAPMNRLVLARDAQDFLQRRLSAQDPRPTVVADRRGEGAGMAFQVLLGRTVVNHGPHLVIDHDQFVDARAATIAAVTVPGPVQGRRGRIGLQVQQPSLVVTRLEGLAVIRIEDPHEALGDDADETRGQQEGF